MLFKTNSYMTYIMLSFNLIFVIPSPLWAGQTINIMEGAGRGYENYTNPSIVVDEEMEALAEKLSGKVRTPGFQKGIQEEAARINSDVLKRDDFELLPVTGLSSGSRLKEDERVYIFISSSIPVDTLRVYAQDLDRLKDQRIIMVMRGFVNGMKYAKPTFDFIRKISKKDPKCEGECEAFYMELQIEPRLFRKYSVDAVPAVVYARGIKLLDPDMGDCQTDEPVEHFMVRGDANLAYTLEFINREVKSESLDKIVDTLHGEY